MKVKDLIARIESDGWVQVRQKGSHRQFHEAIEVHLEGIKEEGAPVPQPLSYSEFIEVEA
jgi:hypothetical protein